jgi:hypothetical protein
MTCSRALKLREELRKSKQFSDSIRLTHQQIRHPDSACITSFYKLELWMHVCRSPLSITMRFLQRRNPPCTNSFQPGSTPHLRSYRDPQQRTVNSTPTARRIHQTVAARGACAPQVWTPWPQSHPLSCCRPALRWRCRTSAPRVSRIPQSCVWDCDSIVERASEPTYGGGLPSATVITTRGLAWVRTRLPLS